MTEHLRRIRLPLSVFLAISVGIIVYMCIGTRDLPESIAMQYDLAGSPSRYSSPAELFWITVSVVSVVAVLFSITAIAFPRLPNNLISMPNRDYWLGKERRAGTMVSFSSSLLWFGSVTMLFLFTTIYMLIKANRSEQNLLKADWPMAIYICCIVVYVVYIMIRFRKAKGE